jgi:hypothetical protein
VIPASKIKEITKTTTMTKDLKIMCLMEMDGKDKITTLEAIFIQVIHILDINLMFLKEMIKFQMNNK